MAEKLNMFRKNRLAVELLITDTINFVVDKFKQGRSNFSVSSAYGQIIFVLHNIAQLILYYIEDSITELNIRTATRSNSVYGLASLSGHNPTRAISATGEISLTMKPTALEAGVNGGVVVLTNYLKLKCKNNGAEYLLDLPSDDVRLRVDTSSNDTRLRIIQGTIEQQKATGQNVPLQTFSLNVNQSALVDNYRVDVYVNGEKWVRYDSIYDIPRDTKGYLLKTGITGGVDVIFGNSFFGKIPELGTEILVEYLITNGQQGNVELSDTEIAEYEWVDTGLDMFGEDVDLNEVFDIKNINSPDFGTNPEPLALTRLVAPKISRSMVLANPVNYIIFLEKFNVFSIIDAYTTFNDNNLEDDNIIFLFLVPDIRKKLKSDENYFNISESRFLLTDAQKQKVIDLIERSGGKIVTTEVQHVDPVISRYVINIALITYEGYAEETIRQEILTRLSEYFISIRRRDRIPRSDLITIIEGIPGVDSVNMSIVSEKDELALSQDPNATPTGLDEFGDIIIQSNELPIIRGGWTDRRGVVYVADINKDKPSSVNIVIKSIRPMTYNTKINQQNKTAIR